MRSTVTWYLAIENDKTVKDPLVADQEDLCGIDEWTLQKGQLVTDWNPAVTFFAGGPEWDGEPDDVLQNAVGLPIYSARLQEALRAGGIEGIQYLPVQVRHADGREVLGYDIANILNLVPCLDWEKAEYRPWKGRREGEVRSITHLVVKGSALQGYDILRMREFKLNIFVSEKFVRLFRAGGFTGYSFAQLTDIT